MILRRIPPNPILSTDSYKPSHWASFPPDMTSATYYLEARGGKFPTFGLFGLQVVLDDTLAVRLTDDMLEEARDTMTAHFGSRKVFNELGWRHVIDDLGGRLPLEIWALPEGLSVPVRNPVFYIRNTHPSPLTAWVPGYFESRLTHVHSPSTTFTKSRELKKLIRRELLETADDEDLASLPWRLHDFGYRGAHGEESAMLNGAAHLANFRGSDTLQAIRLIKYYYGKDGGRYEGMPSNSVPALEHSTIMSDSERNTIARTLDAYPDLPVVAVVIDTYDTFNCVEHVIGEDLKDKVEARAGVVTLRPDSGDPAQIVRQVIERAAAIFGSRTNSKGYTTLSNKIRVIQGDHIDDATMPAIYAAMRERKLSAANLFFGCGRYLVADQHRDIQQVATKLCRFVRGGVTHDVQKTPVTDINKWSKKGVYDVQRNDNDVIESYPEGTHPERENLLRPVFRDGELLLWDDWDSLCARAELVEHNGVLV